MSNNQSAVALVPAAGGGTRLGQGPKAFLKIHGKSLLRHVVDLLSPHVDRVLVGVPEGHQSEAADDLEGRAEIHTGGATRLGTIANLLARSSEPLVVIHDAARPFTTHEVLRSVIDEGRQHGAAGACRQMRVPVARILNGVAVSSMPAPECGTIETPLAYHRSVVERTLRYAEEHGIKDASLSDLVVRSGTEMRAIIDSEWNFKITTPLDWEIATKVIAPAFWPAQG